MKKIIFGGSFDPIHNGHISIARKALMSIEADELIFIPSASSLDNKKYGAKYEDRLEMIKIAINCYPKFKISDIESDKDNILYTYDTIKEIQKNNKKDDFYILIGADQYINFNKWNNSKLLRELVTILVYPRDNIEIKKLNKKDIILNGKIHHISSSSLIEKMEEDKINSDVLEYINNNGIYGVKRLKLFEISDYRIGHSIQVANLAVKFARKYGKEISRDVFVAGLYHDFCKEGSRDLLERIAKEKLGIKNYPSWTVLHGPVAAYIVQKIFCFKNEKVVNAIMDHVMLSNPNSLTSKIVFCADKLALRNKGNFKNREIVVEIAVDNIDEAYNVIKTELDKKYKET